MVQGGAIIISHIPNLPPELINLPDNGTIFRHMDKVGQCVQTTSLRVLSRTQNGCATLIQRDSFTLDLQKELQDAHHLWESKNKPRLWHFYVKILFQIYSNHL